MKVSLFRIVEFRSIQDSGWQEFSPDGVTVLIGQNESGKSSVLEALNLTNEPGALHQNDLRIGTLPEIHFQCHLSEGDLESALEGRSEEFCRLAKRAIKGANNRTMMRLAYGGSRTDLEPVWSLVEPTVLPAVPEELWLQLSEEERERRNGLESDFQSFLEELIVQVPYYSLYSEVSSGLPDRIDLKGEPIFAGLPGGAAAANFVAVAELEISELASADDRLRASMIRRANDRINHELGVYWTQFVGKEMRIRLECEFSRASPSEGSGSGYLNFWVSEGAERFYPSQRSKGTRWFLSVFLHLLATKKKSENYVVLLDEPGSYLHIKAQEDVSRLINNIAAHCPIVYSTHSPELIDFSKLYRVLAVERSGGSDLADTKLHKALGFICSSSDTLTPILQRMGADMRRQGVVRVSGNVILEEPSAAFYLKAMMLLLDRHNDDLSFIPASGVNNVPTLFSLLSAWGLKFAVLLDDDKQARGVRKELTQNFFGNIEDKSSAVLARLRDKQGIEDAFSQAEFFDLVLGAENVANAGEKNSDYAKRAKIKKAVVAYLFFLKVENREVEIGQFSTETTDFFTDLFNELVAKSK